MCRLTIVNYSVSIHGQEADNVTLRHNKRIQRAEAGVGGSVESVYRRR